MALRTEAPPGVRCIHKIKLTGLGLDWIWDMIMKAISNESQVSDVKH